MAKSAKTAEIEISDKVATKFVSDIFERLDVVDEARNAHRVIVHREREAMNGIYESLAARGVPQKSSRIHIKIALALKKIEGWIADLEMHERKIAEKLTKAAGDKRQLSLFGDVPKPTLVKSDKPEPKPKRAKKAKEVQTDLVEQAEQQQQETAPIH